MRRHVRASALIVVGFMLLQVAWILTIPPFRGIDEFDHAFRAAAVAGGEWRPGPEAQDGRGFLVTVPESLVTAAHAQCERLDYTGPDNCSPVRSVGDGRVLVASAAARYPPGFYALIGSVARPFEGASALYAMRVATAALCLALLGLAGWSMSRISGGWPIAATVLAATPVLIYSTTVAAPNGVEMCAGVALWASLLALSPVQERSMQSKLLLIAGSAAVVLCSLRVLGPVFVALTVVTVTVFNGPALREVVRQRPRATASGALLAVASTAFQAWWMLEPVTSAVQSEGPDNPTAFKIGDIVVWPLQAIAAFPLRNEAGAAVVYPVILILTVGLLTVALRWATRRQRTALIVGIVVSLAIPYVFTLATLGIVGSIWQGRYGLPYGVGFVLMAGAVLGRTRPHVVPWRISLIAGTAYAVATAACLLKIRADDLTGNVASREDAAWHEPTPGLIVALVVVATAAFVVAVSRDWPTSTSSRSNQSASGRTVSSA